LTLGAFFIVAGLFGDFSGRHEIFPIPIAVGIAMIAAVLFVLWRRRRKVSPSPGG
jgi:LPXTG-motif cell wall-anchored protein